MERFVEQRVLAQYGPNEAAVSIRHEVIKILHLSIRKLVPRATIFNIGSFPFKTYLLDGDLDITVFVGYADTTSQLRLLYAFMSQLELAKLAHPEYNIRKLQVIQAGVSIFKGEMKGISFDISVNQVGASYALQFLNMASMCFGGSFYKRCVLITKAWARHSARIDGSANGLLSSYAIETLVLYLLNTEYWLESPIHLLVKLIMCFSEFDWEDSVITVTGIQRAKEYGSGIKANNGTRVSLEAMQGYQHAYSACLIQYGFKKPAKVTEIKWINIIDPVNPTNNLGKCINRGNYLRIVAAFKHAAELLNTAEGVQSLFRASNDGSIQPRLVVGENVVTASMRWGSGESTCASSVSSISEDSPKHIEQAAFNLSLLPTVKTKCLQDPLENEKTHKPNCDNTQPLYKQIKKRKPRLKRLKNKDKRK